MLTRLLLTDFRNYTQVEFHPSPSITLIFGENGSGKSNLLESIYTLSTGRSFRPIRGAKLIRQGQDACFLYADVIQDNNPHGIGMSRQADGIADLKIDGLPPSGLSEMARLLPVRIFHPNSIELVVGDAAGRRSFLDWGLFHVEQSYVSLVKEFRHSLKQRNALLKNSVVDDQLLAVWDKQLVEVSGRIDRLRRKHLKEILAKLERLDLFQQRYQSLGIYLHYYAGWSRKESFDEALFSHRLLDKKRGFTSVGPQRADFNINAPNAKAKDVLSRGQAKLLSYLLLVAQLRVVKSTVERDFCILVDDLPSEFDVRTSDDVIALLIGLKQQLVITSITQPSSTLLSEIDDNNIKMFHVEHAGNNGGIDNVSILKEV